MRPVAEARDQLLRLIVQGPAEELPVGGALGRILREPLAAPHPHPAFDNSAMDGYAVRATDLEPVRPGHPASLRCIGQVAAGATWEGRVNPGECVRLFTGAPLPEGADAVVMQEETRPVPERPGEVQFLEAVRPWENVRLRGEEFRRGDLLIPAGTRLGPAQLALAAAAGCGQVIAAARPRVCVIATGSELLSPGSPPAPGKIYESNRVLLEGLAAGCGADLSPGRVVEDDPARIGETLREALESHAFVITSGGVSVGEYDWVQRVFESLGGRVEFWKVAVKPGKPLLVGTWKDRVLFGLPGNPVSAFVTFLLFVRPALLAWQGAADRELHPLPGLLAERLENRGDRPHFLRVCRDREGRVRSAGLQASHAVRGLALANALLELPPDTAWEAGRPVSVLAWEFL